MTANHVEKRQALRWKLPSPMTVTSHFCMRLPFRESRSTLAMWLTRSSRRRRKSFVSRRSSSTLSTRKPSRNGDDAVASMAKVPRKTYCSAMGIVS